MDNNQLMNDVAEIMDNVQELPPRVNNRLLAAMILHSYGVANKALIQAEINDKRLVRFEVLSGLFGTGAFILAFLKLAGIL